MTAWFAFFGRDFLASTLGWSAEERGHYLTLLVAQWENDGLPNDLKRLELISPGVGKCWKLIEAKFPVGKGGRRRNVRWSMSGTWLTNGASGLVSPPPHVGQRRRVPKLPTTIFRPKMARRNAIAHAIAYATAYARAHAPAMLPCPCLILLLLLHHLRGWKQTRSGQAGSGSGPLGMKSGATSGNGDRSSLRPRPSTVCVSRDGSTRPSGRSRRSRPGHAAGSRPRRRSVSSALAIPPVARSWLGCSGASSRTASG